MQFVAIFVLHRYFAKWPSICAPPAPPPSFPLSSFKFCEVLAAAEAACGQHLAKFKRGKGKGRRFGFGHGTMAFQDTLTRAHTHARAHRDASPLQRTIQNCIESLCFSMIERGKCCAFFAVFILHPYFAKWQLICAPPPSFPLSSLKFCEVLAAAEAACGQHLAKF